MKSSEIRELKDDELAKKLAETRAELFNLNILVSTSQTTNVARLGNLRRDVARIKGIIRERQLRNSEENG